MKDGLDRHNVRYSVFDSDVWLLDNRRCDVRERILRNKK